MRGAWFGNVRQISFLLQYTAFELVKIVYQQFKFIHTLPKKQFDCTKSVASNISTIKTSVASVKQYLI